jgi:hypothetical protein
MPGLAVGGNDLALFFIAFFRMNSHHTVNTILGPDVQGILAKISKIKALQSNLLKNKATARLTAGK